MSKEINFVCNECKKKSENNSNWFVLNEQITMSQVVNGKGLQLLKNGHNESDICSKKCLDKFVEKRYEDDLGNA